MAHAAGEGCAPSTKFDDTIFAKLITLSLHLVVRDSKEEAPLTYRVSDMQRVVHGDTVSYLSEIRVHQAELT